MIPEEKRRAALARLRAKMASDPEVAKRAAAMAQRLVGAHIAAQEAELPQEAPEAVAEGYAMGCAAELARKPPWYTDVPLLGRLLRATLGRRRT